MVRAARGARRPPAKVLDVLGGEVESQVTLYVYADSDVPRFQQRGKVLSNAELVWLLERLKLAILTDCFTDVVEEGDDG